MTQSPNVRLVTEAAAVAGYAPIAEPLGRQVSERFSAGGVLTVGAGTSRVYNDRGRTLTFLGFRASVGTAPTGSAVIVDINKGGTTIFGTQANRPTIAATTFTATGGAASVTTWAAGEYLTVDIDQIGSTVAGSNLVVQIVAQ